MKNGYISFIIPISAINEEQRYKLKQLEIYLDYPISISETKYCLYGFTLDSEKEKYIKDYIINDIKIDTKYVYWNDDISIGIDIVNINNNLLRKIKLNNIQKQFL